MKQLENLLAYQQTDMKLYKIESSLRTSEEAKQVSVLNKKLTLASEELIKLERSAAELAAVYEKDKEESDALIRQIEEIGAVVDDISDDDIGEIDFYEKKLDKLSAALENVSKDAQKSHIVANDIREKADKTFKLGQELTQKLKAAKLAYEKLKKEKQPEAAAIIEELAAAEKGVDAQALAAYKKLRGEKKMPAVVLCENNACTGCGMDVAVDVLSKLSGEGVTECPNCGRILYKQ